MACQTHLEFEKNVTILSFAFLSIDNYFLSQTEVFVKREESYHQADFVLAIFIRASWHMNFWSYERGQKPCGCCH